MSLKYNCTQAQAAARRRAQPINYENQTDIWAWTRIENKNQFYD